MVCVVLAAGYATRLHPLTLDFPKPLLTVGGRPILDWLLSDIGACRAVSRVIVVSNHRFIRHFEQWAQSLRLSVPLELLDDGSMDNDTRLGAVRDIQLAAERLRAPDDLLVAAGDNVLDFSLGRLIRYAEKKRASCVMRYPEEDPERLRKGCLALVDEDDLVLRMEEKPAEPFSRWYVPPFYLYAKADLPLLGSALAEGCSPDAPGSAAAWLSRRAPVYAMEMPGARHDIGDPESYRKADREYRGIVG